MGVGPLYAALAGWAFQFINTQVNEQRKAQIERVNAQLSDLYGPLLACVTATKSAYTALVRQHSPDGTREGLQAAVAQHPDGPEARAFRSWMRSVLQPLNERAAEIVQGGFALLEGTSHLEADLLQLVAHVSASRVILERWSQGDLTTTSAISYPDTLEQSVRREFSRVKARQAALLGVRSPFHWWTAPASDADGAGGGGGSGQAKVEGGAAQRCAAPGGGVTRSACVAELGQAQAPEGWRAGGSGGPGVAGGTAVGGQQGRQRGEAQSGGAARRDAASRQRRPGILIPLPRSRL